MDTERRQTIEYKFLRQNTHHPVPKKRYTFAIYLALFHVAFVVLMGFFSKYNLDKNGSSNSTGLYASKRLLSIIKTPTLKPWHLGPNHKT